MLIHVWTFHKDGRVPMTSNIFPVDIKVNQIQQTLDQKKNLARMMFLHKQSLHCLRHLTVHSVI